MKKSLLTLIASLALTCGAGATPTVSTGTPNLASQITGSSTYALSPRFGVLVNFDDLASTVEASAIGPHGEPAYALPAGQYASVGVSSISDPGGLDATIFSQQSPPVYLTTFAGTTDTTITLTNPANIIGIGLEGDGSTPVTLEALGATNNILATFTGLVPDSANNPDNGYYVISDTASDIRSLVIVSNQNLGIDDLQFAPEPASFSLFAAGVLLLAFSGFRKARKLNIF